MATEWTLRRAAATARFWWVVLAFFGGLFAWYAVQVHQTKYLVEAGFPPMVAAWALGMVSAVAIPGDYQRFYLCRKGRVRRQVGERFRRGGIT